MGFVASYVRNLASLARRAEPVRPLLFSYYVTHRCDLFCRHCSDGSGRRFKEDPIPELSTGEAKTLISILRGAADWLDVTGGEPLLRADLEEILDHARQVGFRIVLNTKGAGLTERPELMRLADILVLGVDALDAPSVAALAGCPEPTASKILDGLSFALSRRGKTSARVVLSVVATPANLDEVGRVLRFAAEHSAGFQVSPQIVGRTANPELLGNPRYEQAIDEAIRAKADGAMVFGVPEYLFGIRSFGRFRCHPFLMPVIRPDGRLYYPCLESQRAEVSVLEAGSYEAALRTARARHGDVPACEGCCHIFCHMGLSLLQRHPLSALREMKPWRRLTC